MNAVVTARRVLTQLRHDPRTVVMLTLLPAVLMTLLRFVFDDAARFTATAPALLGVFPFVVMFLVASVTTLRERTTTTLERLMTTPLRRFDLVAGYALAFGLLALVQVGVATGVCVLWLDLEVSGPLWAVFVVVALDALLGVALGLLVSAFAGSEFQAIQFMPVFVLPQFLLCGLLTPREAMHPVLGAVSDALPLSYAVEALGRATSGGGVDAVLVRDMGIVAGCAVAALVLGATTLRRRTA